MPRLLKNSMVSALLLSLLSGSCYRLTSLGQAEKFVGCIPAIELCAFCLKLMLRPIRMLLLAELQLDRTVV